MVGTEFQVVIQHNRWQVRRNGAPIGRYVSQDEAAIAARAAARKEQPARVVIHAADGHPQSRSSYPSHRS